MEKEGRKESVWCAVSISGFEEHRHSIRTRLVCVGVLFACRSSNSMDTVYVTRSPRQKMVRCRCRCRFRVICRVRVRCACIPSIASSHHPIPPSHRIAACPDFSLACIHSVGRSMRSVAGESVVVRETERASPYTRINSSAHPFDTPGTGPGFTSLSLFAAGPELGPWGEPPLRSSTWRKNGPCSG